MIINGRYYINKDSEETTSFICKIKKKLYQNKVKKILFINPPDGDSTMFRLDVAKRGRYNNNPPYGLGVLSSIAKEIDIEPKILNLNHEILKKSFDCNDEEKFEFNKIVNEKIKESISDFQPDLIGITCLFTMSHQSFKEVAEYLSTIFCGPIIAGGVHVTNDAERVLDDVPQLDAIILREAEVALKHFLLNVNEEDKPENLNQIIFKEENKYYEISNSFSSPTVEDFDIHPEMKLMEVNELSRYGCVGAYRYLVENSKITTLLSNKGCRGKCTFCCVSTFNGKGVRKRNVKSVVDEIEKLHSEHEISHFTWLDDDLLADEKRCISLFNEIEKRNLEITWDASNGLIAASVTEDIIHAAAESGCLGLVIGVESGNPEILKSIKKPGTVSSFRRAAKILKKFPQIYSNVFLMIGFPNETFRQIKQTIDLAFEMDLDWYKINTLQALPNTPIYESMLGDGMIEQMPLTKSIHFDKQGGYGKVEDVESNKKNIRETIEKIFESNDLEKCPTQDELMDIWFYMVYHLNFERLNLVKEKEKAQQHYCHLNHIAKRVLPEHAFALYYMGVLSQILEKELDEKLIKRLQNQLSNSIYWRNRFKEVGIFESIHSVWKEHLQKFK